MPKDAPPVEAGNSLSLADYEQKFLPDLKSFEREIALESAATISVRDLRGCFSLIELTSKADYESSKGGWRPRAKRNEMKLPDMRYLLIRDADKVGGFASFMLTYEDGHEVVYLYEIHLAEALRGQKLGKGLMKLVEDAGKRAGMEKAMLSQFVCNSAARAFYDSLGYAVDDFSPEPRQLRNGTIEPDYVILSKQL